MSPASPWTPSEITPLRLPANDVPVDVLTHTYTLKHTHILITQQICVWFTSSKLLSCLREQHQASGATAVNNMYILMSRAGGKYQENKIRWCTNLQAFDESLYISAGFDIPECGFEINEWTLTADVLFLVVLCATGSQESL